MARGLAYDSDEGRAYAGAITAIMTGEAYHQSSVIARDHGWTVRRLREEPRAVPGRDADAPRRRRGRSTRSYVPRDLLDAARSCWDDAIATGEEHGYRNAQATVLAPTGTIGFLMDCDTTGIEPDIAIVKYKNLVGGGMMKIVNNTVPEALERLGYTAPQVDGDHRLHRQARHDRGRAGAERRASAGLRLRLQARQRRALDPLHGPRQDDGGRAAVHLRRDLQDGQYAARGDRRRDRRTPMSKAGSWA